jgi:hypothetical protein
MKPEVLHKHENPSNNNSKDMLQFVHFNWGAYYIVYFPSSALWGCLKEWNFKGMKIFWKLGVRSPMCFILFSACSQCVFNGSLLHSQFVPWIVPNKTTFFSISFAQSSNLVCYIYILHAVYWLLTQLSTWVLITYQLVVDMLTANNKLTSWYSNFKF